MSTTYGRNETLTNFARGFAQNRAKALANFIAPSVITGVATGQFKSFADKNSFQVPGTARATGGPAKRISFDSTDAYFHCAPHALEVTIDEQERKEAGQDQGMLEQAKTQTVISVAALSHEIDVFTAARAGTTAMSGKGVWSSAEVDPIAEIDAAILAIAQETGILPNRIVIGLSAWSTLRNHPKVIARQPGAAVVGASTAVIAAMLINPDIEIRIGVMAYDTTKPGKTQSNAFVIGNDVYVFYASDTPSQYDASFMKTFTATPGNVMEVRLYQDTPRLDVVAVDWTEDIQLVSASCGKRIAIS